MADTKAATPWTDADVSDQHGRTAVVTGANTGLVSRRPGCLRGAAPTSCWPAETRRRRQLRPAVSKAVATPSAEISTLPLDLASLASVRRAAERLRAEHPRIDLLVNNAGGDGSPPAEPTPSPSPRIPTTHARSLAAT
ncbi:MULTISPECIES: SDR family NAD(P)-dependent oxidoreductase [unclassified Frankia]|uniref:SDR family NAD(P)-dependent oxidoreductase n=1 Tax=unclassified Frankia TaxID=2632575 RepID=UPI001EF70DC8|nr:MULTISPECIES: SDR family NAD(P)-dependent oxidoreductase [unclassified Frankia]